MTRPHQRHTFFCIDAHTCGNPVRVVANGAPDLPASSASARRQAFMRDHDWIRTGLMFEPRGHDVMSGAILYPSTREDCDSGIVFIEVSGCLPMCGHGTIGTVTVAIEEGLVTPRTPGVMALDAPAGRVVAEYVQDAAGHVDRVKITNVPSFLAEEEVTVDCPDLGELTVDIAYGGNYYAIVDPQKNFRDLADLGAGNILRLSPLLRAALNERVSVVHPEDDSIRGVSHIQWTGAPTVAGADARNAVFYGDKAIDRSPCGTGTSARMAQWAAKGRLKPGDTFVHESIIGSLFTGRIEAATTVGTGGTGGAAGADGGQPAIVPSIEGWARITGHNTLFIDEREPFACGFLVG